MEAASTTCSVQYHAPWHDLKHVWVGRSYGEHFYDCVKNSKIRDSLQKIARETEEDYAGLVNTLESLGVQVERPTIDVNSCIMDYVDPNTGSLNYQNSHSFTLIPRPPMQPRDCQLVVGKTLVVTNTEAKWFNINTDAATITTPQPFDAPMATVIGDCIILDCREDPWLEEYFIQQFPDYRIVPVHIGGHNDAVFCPVKPGVLVSTYHHTNYQHTFPNWTVKYIENQSWNAIPDWRQLKHSNTLRWWCPDRNHNAEFDHFVDTWLTNWLGYVAETVFDVNMLQINERVILVNNYNREMFEFFKQQQIEPIVVPFRHRFFWDGGLHCITGDIYRQGSKQRYVNAR